MQIPIRANAAIAVSREWANLNAVRVLLRDGLEPERQIEGSDLSHFIHAHILDVEDNRGLWIELNTERHVRDPSIKLVSFMIPWQYVLSVALIEEFSPAIKEAMRKYGF